MRRFNEKCFRVRKVSDSRDKSSSVSDCHPKGLAVMEQKEKYMQKPNPYRPAIRHICIVSTELPVRILPFP